MNNEWIYDLETYPNYFTVFFKNVDTGEYRQFTDNNLPALCEFLNSSHLSLIGFNNSHYDDVMLMLILASPNVTTAELKTYNDSIIEDTENDDVKAQMFKVRKGETPWYSIDIKAVTYGVASLKKQQIRYRWKNVLETPIDFNATITAEQKTIVDAYCRNDVDSTEFLYNRPENIDRVQLRLDLVKKYPYLKGITNINNDSALGGKIMRQELINHGGLKPNDLKKIIAHKQQENFHFIGSEHIFPHIEFQDEDNSRLLFQLRALTFASIPINKRPKGYIDPLAAFTFKMPVSGDTYTMGEGGAHSKIGAVVATDNIWHADVASYYPAMILNIDAPPKGLPYQWVEIYRKIVSDRLHAKNTGQKAEAQFLKIPLNATYGQMGDPNSISYDRTNLLRVTINGQLLILMLCESLELRGHKLLSVNTDGIFFTAGESGIDDARTIINDWSKTANLSIEVEKLDAFVANNVSAYAVREQGEWIKRTDIFYELGAKDTPAVVSNAVLNYIVTGEPIEDHIRNCVDIYDFLTAKSVDKRYTLLDGLTRNELQKVNRIYRSTGGSGLLKRHNANGKITAFTSNVVIYNHIPENSVLPNDIDYNWYINTAAKWLKKLTGTDYPAVAETANGDKKVYFTITHKVEDNRIFPNEHGELTWREFVNEIVKDNELLAQKTDALLLTPCQFKRATDSGCKHAPVTPGEAEQGMGEVGSVKLDELGKPFTWKGGANIELWYMLPCDIDMDVTINEAKQKFKDYEYVLYTTFNHQTGASPKDKFRILFLLKNPVTTSELKARKVAIQHWLGSHDKSSLADFRGFYLPSHSKENKDFVEFFHNEGKALDLNDFALTQPKPKIIKAVKADFDKNRILDDLTKIGALTYPDWFGVCCALKDNGFDYSDFEAVSKCLRQGKTNDSRSNWDRANEHTSCAYDMGWVQRLINSRLNPTGIQQEKLHVKEITVLKPLHGSILPELKQAYDRIDKFGVVQAQPGAGKTTMITEEIIIEVMAKNKVFVVVQGKDQMTQLAAALKNRLDSGDFTQFGIVFLEASETMPVGDDTSTAAIPDGALAVITHFTYAGRWGESSYLYSALKFVDDSTLVLIDEVDAYVDSLAMAHDFGGRAKRQVVGGQTQDRRIASCMVTNGSGNCSQCFAVHDIAADYSIGDYHVPEFDQRLKFSSNIKHTPTPKYDYKKHNPAVETFNIGTNEITILSQTPEQEVSVELFHQRGGDNNINRDMTLEDMFKSAYCPTIHRPMILQNDAEIDVPTITGLMLQSDGKHSVENLEAGVFKFPVRPCNVLTFAGFNRKPFILYRRTKKVVGFSATLASIHKNYLTEMLPDCQFIKVPVNAQRKLKKLILVGLDYKVSSKRIIKGELKSGANTILKFCPKKNKAYNERMELVENGIDAALFTNKLSKTDIADASRITNTHIKFVITHALGSLGRGINLPEFNIVSVDLGSHKPTCAYSTSDKRSLLVAMLDQQLATVVQNAGRIFRWQNPVEQDSGIRVVFVENLKSLSDDLRNEFKINSTDVYNYLREAFAESFEEFEEWLIPVFQSKDSALMDLSHVFTNLTLPADRLITWDDCLNEIKKTGTGKGSRIREDVLDVCSLTMSEMIKSAKDEYNSGVRSKAAGKSIEKIITDKKIRIEQLLNEGKTPGVIKSTVKWNKLSEAVKAELEEYFNTAQEKPI